MDDDARTARPGALVPVAVAAWEQAWRVRGRRMTLCHAVCAITTDRAQRALAGAPAEPIARGLWTAWHTVHPVMERLMLAHGYLPASVAEVREDARLLIGDMAHEAREHAESHRPG
ncbi:MULTISPECIES: hypothetical protein [Actinomadura]|uniref:Uncharacterized protein n=1 Tax=Actinomadura yumaensis TaxID=111807 RepID=A0ABW2CTV8_9ACTN|nr:hypothetical protein [Actinomadura sp. J1-007]MWK32635.1 hypothetical protein [Actinomadura sp. J1-007]